MIESASSKTIIVGNDLFKFLEKYDFNVISLEENENLTDKVIADVKTLIQNGEIDYIFLKQNEDPNNTIKAIVDEFGIEIIYIHTLSNITETERNNNEDYLSIMNENLELLKQELYD